MPESPDAASLEQEIKNIALAMKVMKKAMAKDNAIRKRSMIADKKRINTIRKEMNSDRRKFWQLILKHSKNEKDIALDGISGGLNLN